MTMPNDNPQPATEPSEFALKIARLINTRKTVKGKKPCDCLRCQRADIAVARIIEDALKPVVEGLPDADILDLVASEVGSFGRTLLSEAASKARAARQALGGGE